MARPRTAILLPIMKKEAHCPRRALLQNHPTDAQLVAVCPAASFFPLSYSELTIPALPDAQVRRTPFGASWFHAFTDYCL